MRYLSTHQCASEPIHGCINHVAINGAVLVFDHPPSKGTTTWCPYSITKVTIASARFADANGSGFNSGGQHPVVQEYLGAAP